MVYFSLKIHLYTEGREKLAFHIKLLVLTSKYKIVMQLAKSRHKVASLIRNDM